MQYFKIIFSLLLVLLSIRIDSKELVIHRDAELFENQLFSFLYKKIDKKILNNTKFSDLTSQKSANLNFIDAILLYLFSMQDKRYSKYTVWALERMYALSSDAQLNELLLWNLAFQHENKDNFVIASELYGLFKRMFPGSLFYWRARHKEILTTYKYTHECYHDITDVEKTMTLCEEYILDAHEINGDLTWSVIEIYQDLSLRIIKKNLDNIYFYKKKYNYSREISVFFSCLQRIDLILDHIVRFLKYTNDEIVNKKNQIYLLSLYETKKHIEEFSIRCNCENLPRGESFLTEREALIQSIKKQRVMYQEQIEKLCDTISIFINAYYEL